MDLRKEITNHIDWIEKIASLLGDEPITDEALQALTRHDQCELGRWLDSDESKALQSFPEFPELVESHNRFHLLAGEMISALQQDDEARALQSEQSFLEMSQKVIENLHELERKRGGGSADEAAE